MILSKKIKDKFIVGLSGGIGSGKTTVSNMFAKYGIDIIDADIVARELVKPGSAGLQALVEQFSTSILDKNGTLDRAKLRHIAFADENAKKTLDKTLHPIIREQLLNQLAESQSTYCILVAPLLFENGLHALTDITLVIDVPENQQLQRTLQRDGGVSKTIENIIAAQMKRQTRCELADDIIDNSGNIDDLTALVDGLHKKYLDLAALKFKTK